MKSRWALASFVMLIVLGAMVQVNGAPTTSFYQYDGRGTVRMLTNSAGAVTDTYEYDAFGNSLTKQGTTPNSYRYRGEQWDSDLGLYYLRARYYNPVTDRFMSRDPKPGRIGIPHTLHAYLYASADGVNRIDPRGKEDLVEEEGEEEEAPAAEEGEKQLAKRINCVLNTVSSGLDALSTLESGDLFGAGFALEGFAYSFESCSAEAEGEGSGGCCFVAGTPVHTGHGDVPVEKVEVGDEVQSRNRETGKLESERITALTPPHKDNLVELRVEGEHDPLRPSLDHPFWVRRGNLPNERWIKAGNLRVGDLLETVQGNWRRVVSITPVAGQETVYNFTVDLNHDYFVGETGFLVHNANCGCRSGRGVNKLNFAPDAVGPHSTFRRGLDGAVTHWQTWTPNPQNPWGFDPGMRYDGIGGSHTNSITGIDVPTPHVHDPDFPGGVRPALPCEIP